jgi:threonine-phosphate decarboxylase
MTVSCHIPPSKHGGQLRQIAAHYGIPVNLLTDFSANINPFGPPSSVLAAIRQALDHPSALVAYPDLDLIDMKQTIAESMGVHSENVAVANGFVPLLASAVQSRKIERCLLPIPSFNEYRNTLENAGIAIVPFRLSPEQQFEYEGDKILEVTRRELCDSILLANPQNPSGVLCSARRMEQLIEMAARHNVMVFLDEAFIDYCPSESLIRWVMGLKNLIVFRSVTQFYAIPGLRVAYAVGNRCHIVAMNRLIAPWPITSIASDAVCAALNDGAYAEESRLTNDRRRLGLESALKRLKIATYPSNANFLLLRFPEEVDVNRLWEKMIIEERLVLRSCANFEGFTEGHLRIAVRSEPENEMLIRCLGRLIAAV